MLAAGAVSGAGTVSSSAHEASKRMAFFGRYIEVTPHSRLVWTNDESDDGRHHGDLRGKRW